MFDDEESESAVSESGRFGVADRRVDASEDLLMAIIEFGLPPSMARVYVERERSEQEEVKERVDLDHLPPPPLTTRSTTIEPYELEDYNPRV